MQCKKLKMQQLMVVPLKLFESNTSIAYKPIFVLPVLRRVNNAKSLPARWQATLGYF